MTGAVLDRPRSLFELADGCSSADPRPKRGPGTLEALLDSALDRTRTTGTADCPVCHARMTLTRAHAKCTGCGSRLG